MLGRLKVFKIWDLPQQNYCWLPIHNIILRLRYNILVTSNTVIIRFPGIPLNPSQTFTMHLIVGPCTIQNVVFYTKNDLAWRL